MNFENVFVTVGTTKFDKLIHTIINEKTLKILKKRGCKSLTIQIGNGTIIPVIYDSEISLKYYRYKDSICSDIFKADLIISHAGAGTCIDVLEYKKPLITVINDDLMHNHQTELACKLSEEGYCICCTCSSLKNTINNFNIQHIKPFKYNFDKICASYIEYFLHSNKLF